MTLFSYIIPKLLHCKRDYYKDLKFDNWGFTDYLHLSQEIYNNEYDNCSVEESKTRNSLYSFINSNIQVSSELTLIECITYHYDNCFFHRGEFFYMLKYLGKYRKTINGFRRLSNLYKMKKYNVSINENINMTALDIHHKHSIPIIQNRSIYYFSVIDLIKIINNKLHNCENFFTFTLPILNPYTNIAFDKTTLYNIYFYIKHNTHIRCKLFDSFYQSNFDLHQFQINNSQTIMEHHVNSLTKNMTVHDAVNGIKKMIVFLNRSIKSAKKYKMTVSREFPDDNLIEALLPYYNLYLKFIYSSNNQKRFYYKQLFFYKIEKFILFNPKFGRTKEIYQKNFGSKKYFKKWRIIEPNYLPFYSTNKQTNFEDFMKTHTCEMRSEEYYWDTRIFYPNVYEEQDNMIHEDCDSDSESDSTSDADSVDEANNRLSTAFTLLQMQNRTSALLSQPDDTSGNNTQTTREINPIDFLA